MCVCTTPIPGAQEGQKGASISPATAVTGGCELQ